MLYELFSCQVCSFFVVLGRLKLVPEGVELRPWRSLEVRGSPELQNGGLRALEEAWMTTFCLRHFSVKSDRLLCFRGVSRWFQEVSSSVLGAPWEAQSSRTVA